MRGGGGAYGFCWLLLAVALFVVAAGLCSSPKRGYGEQQQQVKGPWGSEELAGAHMHCLLGAMPISVINATGQMQVSRSEQQQQPPSSSVPLGFKNPGLDSNTTPFRAARFSAAERPPAEAAALRARGLPLQKRLCVVQASASQLRSGVPFAC